MDTNHEILRETLARVEKLEERVLAKVESQVRDLVNDQLRAVEFDSQLSAGGLSTIQTNKTTYAKAASHNSTRNSGQSLSKEQRKDAKFWECRRSLKLWPVEEPNESSLKKFLKEKLTIGDLFVEEDMRPVQIRRVEKGKTRRTSLCYFRDQAGQGPSEGSRT